MNQELSTPAKCVLMFSATMMIGFSTLASSRDRSSSCQSTTIARGSCSMAISALTFVTWPKESFDAADASFVIGVLGKPSEDQEVMLAPYVEGKNKIQGRTVQLRRFASTSEIKNCHALLMTSSCTHDLIEQAIQLESGKSVLTIGEAQGFADAGGVLSIVKNGEESILELNLRAADRQQLKIDARLVNVSVLVNGSDTAHGKH
jgi:hypothetical protein